MIRISKFLTLQMQNRNGGVMFNYKSWIMKIVIGVDYKSISANLGMNISILLMFSQYLLKILWNCVFRLIK
jgi:hypothetical protein